MMTMMMMMLLIVVEAEVVPAPENLPQTPWRQRLRRQQSRAQEPLGETIVGALPHSHRHGHLHLPRPQALRALQLRSGTEET